MDRKHRAPPQNLKFKKKKKKNTEQECSHIHGSSHHHVSRIPKRTAADCKNVTAQTRMAFFFLFLEFLISMKMDDTTSAPEPKTVKISGSFCELATSVMFRRSKYFTSS